jgi:hypothetical protein
MCLAGGQRGWNPLQARRFRAALVRHAHSELGGLHVRRQLDGQWRSEHGIAPTQRESQWHQVARAAQPPHLAYHQIARVQHQLVRPGRNARDGEIRNSGEPLLFERRGKIQVQVLHAEDRRIGERVIVLARDDGIAWHGGQRPQRKAQQRSEK